VWSMWKMRYGKRVDITAEWVAELRRRADDLSKIISTYGGSRKA
jgi:hypothetical protein